MESLLASRKRCTYETKPKGSAGRIRLFVAASVVSSSGRTRKAQPTRRHISSIGRAVLVALWERSSVSHVGLTRAPSKALYAPLLAGVLLAALGARVLHERASPAAANRLGCSLHGSSGSSGEEGDARGGPNLRCRGEALAVLGFEECRLGRVQERRLGRGRHRVTLRGPRCGDGLGEGHAEIQVVDEYLQRGRDDRGPPWGTERDYRSAVGAMFMGATPEEVAEVACAIDPFCGGPVTVERL
jgi:hypothetical protein